MPSGKKPPVTAEDVSKRYQDDGPFMPHIWIESQGSDAPLREIQTSGSARVRVQSASAMLEVSVSVDPETGQTTIVVDGACYSEKSMLVTLASHPSQRMGVLTMNCPDGAKSWARYR